jgi:hypothetical protein
VVVVRVVVAMANPRKRAAMEAEEARVLASLVQAQVAVGRAAVRAVRAAVAVAEVAEEVVVGATTIASERLTGK